LLRRALASAGLLLVASLAAFALGELAVRLLMPSGTVLFPRYHTDYRYGDYVLRGVRANEVFRHTSGDGTWQFTTNARGLRDTRDFAYDKPPGVLRVLAVGDSHTQGYEVAQDETFAAVLERYLRGRGRDAEVLNAGVSGFSNAEELAWLEHEGFRYAPDVVVLGFFANDFEDNLKAGLFRLDDGGQLESVRHEHVPGVRAQNLVYSLPLMKWLGENSYFYSLLFNGVWNYFKAALAEEAVTAADPAGPAPAAGAGQPLAATGAAHPVTTAQAAGVFERAVPAGTPITAYQLALATALLERMHALCVARGVRLIVVDIPVAPRQYAFAPSLPPLLVDHLRSRGLEVVSSEALFGPLGGAVDLHRRQGLAHINPLAHALIGTRIGELVAGGAGLPAAAAGSPR
jgi:hypothetical protein